MERGVYGCKCGRGRRLRTRFRGRCVVKERCRYWSLASKEEKGLRGGVPLDPTSERPPRISTIPTLSSTVLLDNHGDLYGSGRSSESSTPRRREGG